MHCDHAGKHFQLLDTPGYPDFIGQAIGAMRGVDTAAIVINAQSGIEVNTRRVFAEAKRPAWDGSSFSTGWIPTTSTSLRWSKAFRSCSARAAPC